MVVIFSNRLRILKNLFSRTTAYGYQFRGKIVCEFPSCKLGEIDNRHYTYCGYNNKEKTKKEILLITYLLC